MIFPQPQFPQSIVDRYPWAFVTGGMVVGNRAVEIFDTRWWTRPSEDTPTAHGIERGRATVSALLGKVDPSLEWAVLLPTEPYPVFFRTKELA